MGSNPAGCAISMFLVISRCLRNAPQSPPRAGFVVSGCLLLYPLIPWYRVSQGVSLGISRTEGYTDVKRSEIKRRPLSDTVLASIEPETREYRELDGSGLYLRVKPDGQNPGNPLQKSGGEVELARPRRLSPGKRLAGTQESRGAAQRDCSRRRPYRQQKGAPSRAARGSYKYLRSAGTRVDTDPRARVGRQHRPTQHRSPRATCLPVFGKRPLPRSHPSSGWTFSNDGAQRHPRADESSTSRL